MPFLSRIICSVVDNGPFIDSVDGVDNVLLFETLDDLLVVLPNLQDGVLVAPLLQRRDLLCCDLGIVVGRAKIQIQMKSTFQIAVDRPRKVLNQFLLRGVLVDFGSIFFSLIFVAFNCCSEVVKVEVILVEFVGVFCNQGWISGLGFMAVVDFATSDFETCPNSKVPKLG